MDSFFKEPAGKAFAATIKFILLVLVFLIAMSARASDCIVYLSSRNQKGTFLIARTGLADAGQMMYSVNDGSAYINAIMVDEGQKRKGVSVALIEHMLAREPHVYEISATLAMDNYAASGLLKREFVSDAECIEAVKRTPMYRAVSKFGFRNVTQCVHSARAELISAVFGL